MRGAGGRGRRYPPRVLPHASPPWTDVLVREHDRFLAFARRHLRDEAAAEDALQAAYVRAVERGRSLKDRDSVVAWFFRVLRRTLLDEHRRRGVRERGLAARRARTPAPIDESRLRDTVCECVRALLPTVRDDQAALLRRVDVEGERLADVAKSLGITANNATVRLHRARKALRERLEQVCGVCTTHGCLDCQCDEAAHGGTPPV